MIVGAVAVASAVVGNVATRIASNNGTIYYEFEAGVNSYGGKQVYVDFSTASGVYAGSTVHLYANDQTAEVEVPTAGNGLLNDPLIVAANDLRTIAFLPQFYSYSLIFIGTSSLPDEIVAHTRRFECVQLSGANVFPRVQVPMTDSATGVESTMELDLTYAEAEPLGTCYKLAGFELCTGNPAQNVVSLGSVGFYKGSNNQICFYEPYRDEMDYVHAIFTVFVLITFLAAFMHLLSPLQPGADATSIDYVWQCLVVYTPPIADLIMLTVTVGFFSQASSDQSHHLFNLGSVRLHGFDLVSEIIWWHTFVATPIFAVIALLILVFASVEHARIPTRTVWWGSWGFEVNTITRKILYGFNMALIFSTIGVVAYGWYDLTSGWGATAIVTLCYTCAVFVSASFVRIIQLIPRNTKSEDGRFKLILFRTTTEFLLLSTVLANTPYDIAGVLSENFSSGLGIALSVTMVTISGRDTAWMLLLAKRRVARVLGAVLISSYIIFFNVIFGCTLFAESGALRNRPELARLCTVAFLVEIFAVSFFLSLERWKMAELRQS